MKILHTADWHLGDRLGRIDRTADLQRAVERVAAYCAEHAVEVLLIAGDLFSELSRPDGLRQSIEHFRRTFAGFLLGGGTVVALTGNHDNENFCQTFRHALSLAAPAMDTDGTLVPNGRLYLATDPGFFRLRDRAGQEVQFILMPYPTVARYLDDPGERLGLDDKNRALLAGFRRRLAAILASPDYRPDLPAVLSAHVHIQGATLPNLFRISANESVVFGEEEFADFAYVALGHIHKPQTINGKTHVRYSGSIERLDLGERYDEKSVVVVDVGPRGLTGPPVELPLDATPIVELDFHEPAEDIARSRDTVPDRERSLVRYQLTYKAGTDNLELLLRELDALFPRWYDRVWREVGDLGPARNGDVSGPQKSFRSTVLDYLQQELDDHTDGAAITRLAETLIDEEEEAG